MTVQRNGALVSESCRDVGRADPDPCVLDRALVDGDLLLTVLTSRASTWTFVTPEPASVAAACPDGSADAPFRDVPAGDVHALAIGCLNALKVTVGDGSGGFSPAGTVSRGQLASFLARSLTAAGFALPTSAPDRFADDDDSTHKGAIDALSAVGVVRGMADGRYGAGVPVTRAQTASLVDRVYALLGGTAAANAPNAFADDEGDVHERAIDHLAALGITGGADGGGFRPSQDVRRDQMASLLARMLSRVVAEGTVSLVRG